MLEEYEWLPLAKRLPIGMRDRKFHGREKRPNLLVGNEPDKYWAYCHSCKQGGVVEKEHVRFGVIAPRESCDLALPLDLIRVVGSVWEHPVGEFLAKKNMDFKYLPEVWYSCTRKRILIQTPCGWMGRDITEQSPQKWITYNRQHFVEDFPALEYGIHLRRPAVVVEDTFSWYKGRFALPDFQWYCSLGTRAHDALMLRLLRHPEIIWFFDGDAAGYKGAEESWRRMRALGSNSFSVSPPPGMDPKDMQLHEIVRLLGDGS